MEFKVSIDMYYQREEGENEKNDSKGSRVCVKNGFGKEKYG